MRNLVKLFLPVAATDARARKANLLEVEALDLGRHVEKAFGAQKKAGARPRGISNEPQVTGQLGQVVLRAEVEIGRASFRIEPRRDCQSLDQRGLPATVLADEDRHPRVERQRLDVADRGQLERVAAPLRERDRDLERPEVDAGSRLLLRHAPRARLLARSAALRGSLRARGSAPVFRSLPGGPWAAER